MYNRTQELMEGYVDLGFKQVGEYLHSGYKVKAPFLESDSLCFSTIGNKEILVVCREGIK